MTATQIIEYLTVDAVCINLGVTPDAVRKALVKGQLPAKWLNVLEGMANRPLPRGAFTFDQARVTE